MKVGVPNKEINDGGFADPFDFLHVPAQIYKLLSLHYKELTSMLLYVSIFWQGGSI